GLLGLARALASLPHAGRELPLRGEARLLREPRLLPRLLGLAARLLRRRGGGELAPRDAELRAAVRELVLERREARRQLLRLPRARRRARRQLHFHDLAAPGGAPPA